MCFRKLWAFCLTTILACVVATGCESNKEDKVRDKDFERIAGRTSDRDADRDRDRDVDQVITRDRDRRDTGRAERSRGMQEIPAEALEVEGGKGARLEYEPSRSGVIYVYDVDNDRVIFVGRVRDRERFRFDPETNRATINSKTVFRSDLNPRNRYRLYFDPAK
jgi:hypothetical protein